MPRPSIAHKIIAEKTVCILLVRGQNPDDDPIYAYVAVRADLLEAFMKAQESGTFYPEDFGVIIEAGEGEPSEEVRHKMETEYGFNHDVMTDIPDPNQARDMAANIQLWSAGSPSPEEGGTPADDVRADSGSDDTK